MRLIYQPFAIGRWILVLFLAFLIFASPVFSGTLEKNSRQEQTKKRRRGGRGGSRMEFEVFKDNFELFGGPSLNMASGDFFSYAPTALKSNSTAFPYTQSTKKNMVFFVAGAQYRMVPSAKVDGFASYISYGFGLMYQRRGMTQDITMINKSITAYEDKTTLNEVYRAHYLSLPVTIRVGKQVFGEVGVTLDYLASGKLSRNLERGTWGDSTVANFYSTFYKQDYKTNKVQPQIGLGYCFGAGYEFSQNVGFRIFGTLGRKYFLEGPNFQNLQLSLQLIGTIN